MSPASHEVCDWSRPWDRRYADRAMENAVELIGAHKSFGPVQAVRGDPEVLFLDEPTVGMDVEARRAFLEGIREFAASGRTIILTTHYLEEADQLAERIVVIDRGVVIADASPVEIKSRVAGKRVSFQSDHPLTEADFQGLPYTSLDLQ